MSSVTFCRVIYSLGTLTASTDCTRRKHGRNTLSRQTKKTMYQRHRRLDGVQVHSAKGDVSGQRAMEEEDTGMASWCHQPLEEGGRLERERLWQSANTHMTDNRGDLQGRKVTMCHNVIVCTSHLCVVLIWETKCCTCVIRNGQGISCRPNPAATFLVSRAYHYSQPSGGIFVNMPLSRLWIYRCGFLGQLSLPPFSRLVPPVVKAGS